MEATTDNILMFIAEIEKTLEEKCGADNVCATYEICPNDQVYGGNSWCSFTVIDNSLSSESFYCSTKRELLDKLINYRRMIQPSSPEVKRELTGSRQPTGAFRNIHN